MADARGQPGPVQTASSRPGRVVSFLLSRAPTSPSASLGLRVARPASSSLACTASRRIGVAALLAARPGAAVRAPRRGIGHAPAARCERRLNSDRRVRARAVRRQDARHEDREGRQARTPRRPQAEAAPPGRRPVHRPSPSAGRWTPRRWPASGPSLRRRSTPPRPGRPSRPLILPVLKRVRHPFPPDAAPDPRPGPAGHPDRVRHRPRAGVHPRLAAAPRALGDRPGDAPRDRPREPPRAGRATSRPRSSGSTTTSVDVTAARGRAGARRSSSCPTSCGPILGDDAARPADARPQHPAGPAATRSTRTSRSTVWEAFAGGAHDELDVDPLRWTGTGRRRSPDQASATGQATRRTRPRAAPCSSVGVVVQPAPPRPVVRPPDRDERPEARAVAEHPQVGELVDDDRLEGLRRREDEPPRERQPALPRRAPPARAGIAQRDRRRA